MSRSISEIKTRLQERDVDLPFDFGKMQLVACLPYEDAVPYLKDEVAKEDFGEMTPDGDLRGWALGEIKWYLDFAFMKAENKRGLSAMRSVQKIREWVWLLDDEDLYREYVEAEYQPYGLPKLRLVRDSLEIDLEASHE